MKQYALWAVVAAVIILGGIWFFGGSTEPEVENIDTEDTAKEITMSAIEDGTFVVVDGSVVGWEGTKTLIKDYTDYGTLNISSGDLMVKEGNVTGTLTFDMNSIQVSETGRKTGNELLTNHLKSDDFFNAEKYPEAMFELKELVLEDAESYAYMAKGDLTLRGETHAVNFPAKVYMADGKLRVEAAPEIDRTKWNVRYGSGKFFKNLGDNVIDDFFTVRIDIAAERSAE